MKHIRLYILFIALSLLFTSCGWFSATGPQRVIFDTDIGPGYDDVGALTMLHALQAEGECKILATVSNNKYEGVAALLDVFNTYWDVPHTDIGIPMGRAVDMPDEDGWAYTLLQDYPHKIKTNNEVPDAVTVYRQLLSIQPDTSVILISAGFLTNLSDLLNSTSDRYSPLDGSRLVRRKVKKLVCMGGEFPEGREFNLYKDISASANVIENWPSPIVFTGVDIGGAIKTGLPLIENDTIINNPAKDAYQVALKRYPENADGYWSWDQTAVMIAVKGVEPFFTEKPGKMLFHDDGSNSWDEKGVGHSYVVFKQSPEEIGRVIDSLMMKTPATL